MVLGWLTLLINEELSSDVLYEDSFHILHVLRKSINQLHE